MPVRFRSLAPLASFLLALFATAASAATAPPPAPVRNVEEEHWGVKVEDPYRYMENIASPEVRAWILAQGAYTDSVMTHLPVRDPLLARIKELDAGRPFRVSDIRRMPSGRMFYMKIRAEENLARLCMRDGADGAERVLIDPSTIKPKDGGHVSISFYEPSPDGQRIAYGLAASGSEQDVLHVLDVASDKDLPDQIDRMEDGYTPPQWLPDGSGFFYSRRQKLAPGAPETDGYKLSRAYRHRLGTNPDQDVLVFATGLWPNVAIADVDFPSIVIVPGSPYAIGKIKHGDANQLTLYATRLDAAGALGTSTKQSPWTMICDVPDSVTGFAVHGESIDLMTARHAPRFKIVRTSLASPDFANASVVVPPGTLVVDALAPAKDALYVEFRDRAALRIGRIGYDAGAKLQMLDAPDGAPSARFVTVQPDVEGALIGTSSWTRGGFTYAYDPHANSFTDTHINPRGKFDDVPGYESAEVEVPGADGVKVPLSIVYKSGIALDGSHPTLLMGYGAYGLSQDVRFNPTLLAWLERGGVYAVAHVRGGGEYGEEWHLAGQKATKPNTWKDFIACGEYLVSKGYTTPEHLAGQGGSAGGITIGRAITERPDLFGAALIDVGAVDATRSEFTMNGVPNIPEFGTVTKPDEFKALLEMSAYQHVKDGVKYPAVMLSHGLNDPRVEPWETAKMTARLQAATASGKPVLFRVDTHAGHGIGSTKMQALKGLADRWSFLLWQLGMVKPVP